MRVVIVEDETLLRQGLHALLTGLGIDVVATAGDAPAALAVVRAHRPDLLITDIRIPPGNTADGLDAALQLRRELPGLAVMVLSQFILRRYAEQLMHPDPRGVGYQLKQRISDVPTFLDDLQRVVAGGTAFDPEVIQLMLGRTHTTTNPENADRSGTTGRSIRQERLDRLTPRQREVLALIAEGRSNSAIAARLHISDKAVVSHTSRIYAELDIADHDEDHRRVLAVLRYLSTTTSDPPPTPGD